MLRRDDKNMINEVEKQEWGKNSSYKDPEQSEGQMGRGSQERVSGQERLR